MGISDMTNTSPVDNSGINERLFDWLGRGQCNFDSTFGPELITNIPAIIHAAESQGNRQRHDRVYFDPNEPPHCQQTDTDSYQRYSDERFDRGHLVPANHADNSADAIRKSNFRYNTKESS